MVSAKITIDMLPTEPPPAHDLPGELIRLPSLDDTHVGRRGRRHAAHSKRANRAEAIVRFLKVAGTDEAIGRVLCLTVP